MASPITDLEEVPEGSTPLITATFRDEDGVAIPGASLDNLSLTLVEEETGAVINGRDGTVDMSASVDGSGVLSLRLEPEDTKHVTTKTTEYHRQIWQWDYDTNGHGVAILRYPVVDIGQV